jgi:hypothetical protein
MFAAAEDIGCKAPLESKLDFGKKIKFGGRNVSVEQRIECGRGVTAVYSGV